jgi:hypothetical protein
LAAITLSITMRLNHRGRCRPPRTSVRPRARSSSPMK